jgi:hypothetical protein
VGCGESEPAQKATEPGTCIITYVPEAVGFLEMGVGNREAWAFRYEGASIQLTLELFHQELPADEVKPGTERFELIGKPTDNDRIVQWASIDHQVIEAFEAGDLSKEDIDVLGINATEGKIVFQLPDWNHDNRTGYASHEGASHISLNCRTRESLPLRARPEALTPRIRNQRPWTRVRRVFSWKGGIRVNSPTVNYTVSIMF